MKQQKWCLMFIFVLMGSYLHSLSQDAITKDTIICSDTTVVKSKLTTVFYDSTYQVCQTIQVPVVTPVEELRGMYVSWDAFTLGNQSSENAFLSRMKSFNVNMLNYYARARLYSSLDRDLIAAWAKKAKEQYGIILITIDVRFTDSREYPSWVAYYQKYGFTNSMIEPLAECEPYRLDETGIYPYANAFLMMRKMDALTKQYGASMNWYEGWMGLHYSNPQAAVDSMVLHCSRIFISNYVSMSDYLSTSTSLGIWDSRLRKRINSNVSDVGSITIACAKLRKKVQLVELQSLEDIYLGKLYACPVSTTNKCRSFYGSLWTATKDKYNQSPADVIEWTDLVGKTLFLTSLLKQ